MGVLIMPCLPKSLRFSKVEAYFNGKGRWKGRHLIMTLQVLKGEYDQILEWPCNLDTTIILRDQSSNKSEVSICM